jgi:VanZ family protein
MLAVAAGVLLSLTIELVQVWLPTRDSSLLDLLMNGLGAAAARWRFRRETVFALRRRTP